MEDTILPRISQSAGIQKLDEGVGGIVIIVVVSDDLALKITQPSLCLLSLN